MQKNGALSAILWVRRVKIIPVGILVALAFAAPWDCSAASPAEIVESLDSGRINWSRWVIYVTEIAGPDLAEPDLAEPDLAEPNPAESGRQYREESKEKDVVHRQSLSFSNLFSTIESVRIDSSHRISDLTQDGSMVCNQLEGMIRKAEVVKREYLSNGAVELTLAFNMKGGFAQLALPSDIQPVPQIRTLNPPAAERQRSGNPSAPASLGESSEPYTGLLLDARGLTARPCMSPKIWSENGQEVYGSAYVSREFAVQKGMVFYTHDLEVGKACPRLGNAPLLVRALRAEGPYRCDFVVSNADAATIQGRSKNLEFLKECKVAIVLD